MANAVGRFALEVGRAPAANTIEATVAEYLWQRGRSPRNVANLLGISVPDVQKAKAKFASELLDAIRSFDSPRTQRRNVMNEYVDLLHRALAAPGDQNLLRQVRENSTAILKALETTEEVFKPRELENLAEQRDWMGTVYSSLAGEDAGGEEESAVLAAMQKMRENEAQEIGEAFAELMNGLDPEFRAWKRWFKELSDAESHLIEHLKNDGSFEAGMPHSVEMLKFGLTPLTVHGATRGLQLLFDRGRRSVRGQADAQIAKQWLQQREPGADVFRLELGDGHPIAHVPFETAVAQVAGTRNLLRQAARPMTKWTFDVLAERPYLINGYYYDHEQRSFAKDDGMWSSPVTADDYDSSLMARWCARARMPAEG